MRIMTLMNTMNSFDGSLMRFSNCVHVEQGSLGSVIARTSRFYVTTYTPACLLSTGTSVAVY
jgi:hypothetical protein